MSFIPGTLVYILNILGLDFIIHRTQLKKTKQIKICLSIIYGSLFLDWLIWITKTNIGVVFQLSKNEQVTIPYLLMIPSLIYLVIQITKKVKKNMKK